MCPDYKIIQGFTRNTAHRMPCSNCKEATYTKTAKARSTLLSHECPRLCCINLLSWTVLYFTLVLSEKLTTYDHMAKHVAQTRQLKKKQKSYEFWAIGCPWYSLFRSMSSNLPQNWGDHFVTISIPCCFKDVENCGLFCKNVGSQWLRVFWK